MIHRSRPPRFPASCPVWPAALLLAAVPVARADRGPENPEIRFPLPPPPVLTPQQAVEAITVPAEFDVQLVASEPMIDTPVAVSFDHRGRMYVVEMRGYMPDKEGRGEDVRNGRIRRLEDTNGDGVTDKATTFAEGLLMPRAVMALGDGALVIAPPELIFYHDADGDGVAESHEVIDGNTGKAGGQPEYLPNSPVWGRDNWIEFGYHNLRWRWQGGRWLSETTLTRSQWGMTRDDEGRLFYAYNSQLLSGDMVPPRVYLRNPNLPVRTGVNRRVMNSQTVWPSHPTPGVNRGYQDKTLRDDGTLASATAVSGPGIDRGGLFPAGYAGNAFSPCPEANLVKRIILTNEDGMVSGASPEKGRDFLTSTDERFRPVNVSTGPDGALYVVDMARGVIQHRHYLTHYLEENIRQRSLEQPISLGRIYRIVPRGTRPETVRLPDETAALVPFLTHANGWVRDTAQRRLVERADASAVPALTELAAHAQDPRGRMHALWTLDGMAALTPGILTASFRDPDARVRAAAVRLADRALFTDVMAMAADPSPLVRLEVAANSGLLPGPDRDRMAVTLLRQAKTPLLAEALAAGLRGRELETVEMLVSQPEEVRQAMADSGILRILATCVITERRPARVARLLELAAGHPEGSLVQRALLEGMAVKGGKASLLYLDKAPALLASRTDQKSRGKDFAAVDAKLAWPDKPGVPPPPVVKPLTAGEQQQFETGRVLYSAICGACHQPNGAGLDGLAPPLVDSEWVLGPPDVAARIVLHGLSGPVDVRGVTWRLEMPAVAGFTDVQIAAVLTYVRREWEHTADPVSPEQVTRIRAGWKDRTTPWSAKELKARPQK